VFGECQSQPRGFSPRGSRRRRRWINPANRGLKPRGCDLDVLFLWDTPVFAKRLRMSSVYALANLLLEFSAKFDCKPII
jgi:hypothetical protein